MGDKLSDELTQVEEALIALDAENKQLRERMLALERLLRQARNWSDDALAAAKEGE